MEPPPHLDGAPRRPQDPLRRPIPRLTTTCRHGLTHSSSDSLATAHGSGLGRERWVVERTFAHLHNLRRLRIRYERSAELNLAFMLLGCAVVSQRRLSHS
jgi:transposase